jgi:hypothetical protein
MESVKTRDMQSQDVGSGTTQGSAQSRGIGVGELSWLQVHVLIQLTLAVVCIIGSTRCWESVGVGVGECWHVAMMSWQ